MKDKVLEDVAGLMDGELPRDRSRFAVRRLTQDQDLRGHWERMHLVRGYLREGHAQPVSDNFLAGIQAQRDAEPQLEADQPASVRTGLSRWSRPLVSTAVAASVAVLALVGVNQNLLEQQPAATEPVSVATATVDSTEGFMPRSSVLEQQFSAAAVPVNFSSDPQATRQRLNDYLLRHNQLSGSNGRFGFVSYMPLVSGEIISEPVDGGQANASGAELINISEPALPPDGAALDGIDQ